MRVEDLEEVELYDWSDMPEEVQKNTSVNSAVFHHLCLINWQVNKHSALIWGDATMRPAVSRVLDKYKDREERFKLVRVTNLQELLQLRPEACLLVITNADEFLHEIPQFCLDWDTVFRFTLMRVLLLSSVDIQFDLDKKIFIRDWVVQSPEASMKYFDYQVHKLKTFREQYLAATIELEKCRQLYEQAKEELKAAIDFEDS